MRIVPATRRAWCCGALTSGIAVLTGIASGVQAEAQTASAAAQPQAAVTGPMTLHRYEGRITQSQFSQLGTEYGRYILTTLYLCGATWTSSSTCGPRVEAKHQSSQKINSNKQDASCVAG